MRLEMAEKTADALAAGVVSGGVMLAILGAIVVAIVLHPALAITLAAGDPSNRAAPTSLIRASRIICWLCEPPHIGPELARDCVVFCYIGFTFKP
jgi:hypothetical protein